MTDIPISSFCTLLNSWLFTAVALYVSCTLMEKIFLVLPILEKTFLVNVFAKLEEGKAVCVGELLKGWEG